LTVPGIPLVQPTAEPVRAAGDDDDNDDEEDGVAADVALPDILGRASSLERLSAQGLPAGFLLYAAVVGDNPADRHAFVRKANPRSAVRPGKIITAFGDRLRHVTEPLLILDDHFDLVMGGGGVAVLNQSAFEQLFRDTDRLLRRFPKYVDSLGHALPIDGDAAKRLTVLCMERPLLGKKLRAVYENGFLKRGLFSIKALQEEARRQGVDTRAIIRGDRIIIEDADQVGTLLKLLNEDLTTGAFSKQRYEVDSKSRR